VLVASTSRRIEIIRRKPAFAVRCADATRRGVNDSDQRRARSRPTYRCRRRPRMSLSSI
jgi:hypothetical protein